MSRWYLALAVLGLVLLVARNCCLVLHPWGGLLLHRYAGTRLAVPVPFLAATAVLLTLAVLVWLTARSVRKWPHLAPVIT